MKAERSCCKIGLSNIRHIASTWAWRWPNIGETYDPNRLALAKHSPTIQQGLNLGLTFLFARFFWVGWYSIAWNALVAILQAKALETYPILVIFTHEMPCPIFEAFMSILLSFPSNIQPNWGCSYSARSSRSKTMLVLGSLESLSMSKPSCQVRPNMAQHRSNLCPTLPNIATRSATSPQREPHLVPTQKREFHKPEQTHPVGAVRCKATRICN